MNSDQLNPLNRLQLWYASMCDGDWEHTYGVTISNIDNPGWSLRIELSDTYLQDRDFVDCIIQRDNDDDWINCKKNDDVFQGYCGPNNLNECLEIFLNWADSKPSI